MGKNAFLEKTEKRIYYRACKGCIYYGLIGPYGCCNYIFIKDERRPCPPGKDCTVKQKRKRTRRAEDGSS